ncbi:MAG TPA: putative nucleotidyltransferase substrate binding domain-containing protein [Burkholderiales bacterium]
MEAERSVLVPTIEALRRHAPFDRMARPHLEFLAKHLRLAFYPRGEIITEPARGPARVLYIIKQGRVRGELEDGGAPREVWELEAGESFPIGAMLARRPVVMRHRAVEDSFCYELDREDFEKLLALSPVFHDFCARRLGNMLGEALRGMQADLATQEGVLSLDAPLASLVRRAPVTCGPDARVRDAVALMHGERVGSVVVTDAQARPLGIFTLHDLLGRVSAQDLSLDTPVAAVMTPAPRALAPQATAHEAMVTMARHGIGHLCIVEDGRLVGVISERDLFSLQRIGVVHLTRAITSAPDIEALVGYRREVHELVERMLVQGASVLQLMQIVALLNDHTTRRVIALCVAEHGDVGVPFAWLSFGSEGRQEQTLKTDQDNGVLMRPPRGMSADEARARLLPLARRINEALATVGFPLCRGNVMAGNPECCLTLEEWRERFARWIEHGEPEHLLNASIYFDVRALEGDARPVEELRAWVLERARAVPRFLRQMAQNALRVEPPLGLLRDFDVESRGEHAHMLNLKLRGATPFVDGARLLALAHGITETNTAARLRAAARRGAVREAEADAWCDAYAFIQLLRMRQHRAQQRAGQAPSNYIDPERLNELDRRVLKEAFRQARKLQSFLALEHRL